MRDAMSATATREIQQAISAAKRHDLRTAWTGPTGLEELIEELEQKRLAWKHYRAARNSVQHEQQKLAEEYERTMAEVLVALRLVAKLHTAPSGLDQKLRRLVNSMNRKLR